MTTTLFGPSEKQVAFIKNLLADREIDEDVAQQHLANLPTMERKTASNLIDALLKLPKNHTRGGGVLQSYLSALPKSRYAVHVDEFELADLDVNLHGNLAFFEIREYMGHLYMRQLVGSVGSFNRVKLSNNDVIKISKVIARGPRHWAILFGIEYSCCGSCGAELTDPVSRELQLGPECRKKFES